MKILFILTLVLILFSARVHSQTCNTDSLEEDFVEELIYKHFSQILSPESKALIGNFASYDVANSKVNFAGSIFTGPGVILGIKATGGLENGFLPIFTNSNINSTLGLNLSFNALNFDELYANQKITYDHESCLKYSAKRDTIYYRFNLDSVELKLNRDKLIKKYNDEINKIILKDKKDRGSLEAIGADKRDSVEVEIQKNKITINYLTNEKAKATVASEEELLVTLRNKRNKKLETARSELSLDGFGFGWFSVNYGIKSNSFKLFNPSFPLVTQLQKKQSLNHQFSIVYSYYDRSSAPFTSYFWSVGLNFKIRDNFEDLTPIELNETKNYGTAPNDRFTTKKYSAYEGAYEIDIKTASLSGEAYWFLFKNNAVALHVFPEYEVSKNHKPITNLGVGLMFSFSSKDKDKPIINAETFLNLQDINNNRDSDDSLLTRGLYGIQFTFPIAFNANL